MDRRLPIHRPLPAPAEESPMRILEYAMCGLAVIAAIVLGIVR